MVVERIALNGTRPPARPLPAAPQGHVDTVLVGMLIVLASFGTLILFSASYAVGIRDTGDSLYFIKRQAVSALLGIAALLITSRVDYHFWRRWSVPAMIGTVLMLLAVLPLGRTVFGARRWFEVGPVQVQPSEIMKFVLILYMADLLDRKGSRIRHFLNGAIPFAIILGAILFLVMLEPDLGTATVLAVVGISVFLIAGADIRQLGLFLMSGAGAFALLALTAPYRRERLLLFLHPERDLRDAGWQLWQARIALGDGGVFGLGLGASRQKFSWLPAAHTDAIFAVLGEELGLVGCAVVIGLFAAIAVRGYRTALRAPDRFGAIMATGITTWLVFQAVINIGGVTTAIPFTGVPLPLFSYGGSSLAVTLGALGVLFNISRSTRIPERVRRRTQPMDGFDDD
jgi:cell division protein FtsW